MADTRQLLLVITVILVILSIILLGTLPHTRRIHTLVRKYNIQWGEWVIQWKKHWKKCRKAEYVQRRVCFVNVQVPRPHSNIYVKLCTSRLCMKMSSFLFVRTWAMPRILYLSCGVPFPVWTPDNISGVISVVLWLSRWEVIIRKNCR